MQAKCVLLHSEKSNSCFPRLVVKCTNIILRYYIPLSCAYACVDITSLQFKARLNVYFVNEHRGIFDLQSNYPHYACTDGLMQEIINRAYARVEYYKLTTTDVHTSGSAVN